MSVTPRLIYVTRTPEALAWAADFKRRSKERAEKRFEWMKAIYDAAGVPEDAEDTLSWKRNRGGWHRDNGYFSGLSWPRDMDDKLPEGWFRPAKEDHLVRPRETTKAGKAARKEMDRFNGPSLGRELEKRFGMPQHTFAGIGLYSCGIRLEDDGVWVTWASKDVEDELADPKKMRHHPEFETAGWEKVTLVEYLQRFGEDED